MFCRKPGVGCRTPHTSVLASGLTDILCADVYYEIIRSSGMFRLMHTSTEILNVNTINTKFKVVKVHN